MPYLAHDGAHYCSILQRLPISTRDYFAHAVWLYFRFNLSYRDVEELLGERGIGVTYETIRQWVQKFGQTFANRLRRRRVRPGDKWHLDGATRGRIGE